MAEREAALADPSASVAERDAAVCAVSACPLNRLASLREDNAATA